jgi:transcriptional regulator with XRE-family HTH domain
MGKNPRRRPRHLPDKLRQIRESLKLSQSEILSRMGLGEELTRNIISNYELGHREPPLHVLLEYAHLAGLTVDVLIDDDLEMPKRLPKVTKLRGVKGTKERRRGA